MIGINHMFCNFWALRKTIWPVEWNARPHVLVALLAVHLTALHGSSEHDEKVSIFLKMAQSYLLLYYKPTLIVVLKLLQLARNLSFKVNLFYSQKIALQWNIPSHLWLS